jgi:hypothetical protein
MWKLFLFQTVRWFTLWCDILHWHTTEWTIEQFGTNFFHQCCRHSRRLHVVSGDNIDERNYNPSVHSALDRELRLSNNHDLMHCVRKDWWKKFPDVVWSVLYCGLCYHYLEHSQTTSGNFFHHHLVTHVRCTCGTRCHKTSHVSYQVVEQLFKGNPHASHRDVNVVNSMRVSFEQLLNFMKCFLLCSLFYHWQYTTKSITKSIS